MTHVEEAQHGASQRPGDREESQEPEIKDHLQHHEQHQQQSSMRVDSAAKARASVWGGNGSEGPSACRERRRRPRPAADRRGDGRELLACCPSGAQRVGLICYLLILRGRNVKTRVAISSRDPN